MLKPRAVIFCIGGTLILYSTFDGGLKKICYEQWERVGVPKDFLAYVYDLYLNARRRSFTTSIEATMESAVRKALQKMRGSLSETHSVEYIVGAIFRVFSEGAALFPGARELLSRLRHAGKHIGLISNTPFPGVLHEEDLQRFGIFEYFEDRKWSSDFGKRKPHSDIFYASLKGLDVATHEAVFIGDTVYRDIVGAQRIGMPSIFVNRLDELYTGVQVKTLYEVNHLLGV